MLSGGAACPCLVLLTLWAPPAVIEDAWDRRPRALGPEGSFCTAWSELVWGGGGTRACPRVELWVRGVAPARTGLCLLLPPAPSPPPPMAADPSVWVQGPSGGAQPCPGQGDGAHGGVGALELLTLSFCVQLCSKRGWFCNAGGAAAVGRRGKCWSLWGLPSGGATAVPPPQSPPGCPRHCCSPTSLLRASGSASAHRAPCTKRQTDR